jgi:hypothetical protein
MARGGIEPPTRGFSGREARIHPDAFSLQVGPADSQRLPQPLPPVPQDRPLHVGAHAREPHAEGRAGRGQHPQPPGALSSDNAHGPRRGARLLEQGDEVWA